MNFKQFLIENRMKDLINKIAQAINAVTNNVYKAGISTKQGSSALVLSLTTPRKQTPDELISICKKQNIGFGDVEKISNDDGTYTSKYPLVLL